MNSANDLIASLKRVLRSKGLTYRQIATAIGLSEATIKRDFSRGDMTVERLLMICRLAGIRLSELSAVDSASEAEQFHRLSQKEESYFWEHPDQLAYLFFLTQEKGRPLSVEKKYGLSRAKSLRYLRQMEELGYLELYPKMKVKMKIPMGIEWPQGGEFSRRFGGETKSNFVSAPFTGNGELLLFLMPQLTARSQRQLLHDIDELFEKTIRLHNADEFSQEKKTSYGVLFAARPWDWSFVEVLKGYLKG